jgi:hypothetical protein
MKSILKIGLSVLLISLLSMSCTTTLKPGTYCYRCCACVGTGSLELKNDGRFEMTYERFNNRREKYGTLYYGEGIYRQQNKALELQFEDLPEIKPSIAFTKIGHAEKIDIRVISVFDPVSNLTVFGANLNIIDLSNKNKVYAAETFHSDGEIHLTFDPARQGSPTLALEASFIGCYTATTPLPGPGLYTAEVTLPFGYADVKFTQKDLKTFVVRKGLEGIIIRDRSDSKVFFTTKSCYCD